ncbi:MAG TPA: hydrogenase expression protein HypE, partial [Rhodospirillaceae bacterium]|nr:hydrogenase expression protein HypE [Rhodospirillaceae bacterium]
VLDEADAAVWLLSLDCPDGRFPSVGRLHAPAQRLERTIADLYGLEAEGGADLRPWLDHGRWGLRRPLSACPGAAEAMAAYSFLPAEGQSLHVIPVGPVHAGIIEPGHFRFTANGETVVRLEERLGYVHKGVEGLMVGADLKQASKLAARVSGDATVAYSFAFARAVEAALAIEVPARAVWLRALMAELERLANHFGDIGAVCNDASFSLMQAHCSVLREKVLRTAALCFGHRLMMDRIQPGGVACDLDSEHLATIRALLDEARHRFPRLAELYDNTASLKDRTVGTGHLSPALARRFGAGGFVGRASGRGFDCRRSLAYAPYDEMLFGAPVVHRGDVNARVWVRIVEVGQSLGLIEQILDGLSEGPVRVDTVRGAGVASEGLALVESFRGDVLVWVRLDEDGKVLRCHLRDPSWFQWPLLEAVIEGNIVADFPLCNKSFNCSYSGHDL